jgi:hypothetical protein
MNTDDDKDKKIIVVGDAGEKPQWKGLTDGSLNSTILDAYLRYCLPSLLGSLIDRKVRKLIPTQEERICPNCKKAHMKNIGSNQYHCSAECFKQDKNTIRITLRRKQ